MNDDLKIVGFGSATPEGLLHFRYADHSAACGVKCGFGVTIETDDLLATLTNEHFDRMCRNCLRTAQLAEVGT